MAGLDGMQAIMSPAARVWRVPYLQLAILRYSTPHTVDNVARCSQQTFQAAVRVLYHHMDAHQLDLIMRICSIVRLDFPLITRLPRLEMSN
jgi:hypothetical protein